MRRRQSGLRFWTGMALLWGAGLVAMVLVLGFQVDSWSREPHGVEPAQEIVLARGMGFSALTAMLARQGVIDSGWRFKLWVRVARDPRRFQAGTYRFQGDVSPSQVYEAIASGKIYRPVSVKWTIPEGARYRDATRELVRQGVGSEGEFRRLFRDRQILSELRIPSQTLEGYLFPATYTFYTKPTPEEALRKSVETFWDKLPEDYISRLASVGLTLAQAVTFASLVETETKVSSEKPLISEVIWRRIKSGEPLGIDAALIYGIPDYAGDIKRSHLRDRKNPYNTRFIKGLPPTPIGSPSISALTAVLEPAAAGNRFFVAMTDGSGRHHFSATLEEHTRWVRELVKATREPRNVSNREGGK